ncbi:MAG: hypothetical protein CBD52_001395 [Euryarchaeota archaeon TMED192]|nr:MAG: hypothetical protein CBD52_001395 [Euryarchaeota archaeon TMED192]|tara:strand:- start:3107 stop:3829 length:723 start_codon:yes stop_codon:yes gene_type:complete
MKGGIEVPNLTDIDMIVFDVDGTLMDRSGMPEGLVGLVKEIEKNGVSVSLASGRTLPNLTPIHQALGLTGFIVAENGGILWDGPRKRGIEPMANGKRCRDAIEWLAGKMVEIDPAGIESNRWRETEWCVSGPYDVDRMRALLADSEWSDLRVVGTGFAIHVTERDVNKRSALEIQLSRRGIDPSRVLSCGDALNDVSMFNLTGYSVAVDGTIAEVFDAAGSVTQKKGPLGVIEMLELLLR